MGEGVFLFFFGGGGILYGGPLEQAQVASINLSTLPLLPYYGPCNR